MSLHTLNLCLKFTPDLKWNYCFQFIAKDAGKAVCQFYRSKKYPTPSTILYLSKSQIRLKMEYCCHILVGAAQSPFSRLDRIQNLLNFISFLLDNLFPSETSLSLRCHFVLANIQMKNQIPKVKKTKESNKTREGANMKDKVTYNL